MSEFTLVTTETINYEIDWKSCILCQRKTNEKLVAPIKKTSKIYLHYVYFLNSFYTDMFRLLLHIFKIKQKLFYIS